MISVILTGYGGPGSLEEVEPFMNSIARGRNFTPQQIENAKKRYEVIGGKSPINNITSKQASALEIELKSNELNYSVDFGMLHLKPFISDVIKHNLACGIKKLAIVTLAPFHSRVSTGAYFSTAKKLLENENVEVVYISKWNNNPIYIKAIAEEINKSLHDFFSPDRDDVNIIFTVHSLPQSFIELGDPYVDEVKSTIELVLSQIKSSRWHLAYQSKGRGDDWLKPDVESVLKKIADNKESRALIVPLGFVSDHVETLYDIDILYKEFAGQIGIDLKRVSAMNDSPLFIKALADEVRKNTKHWQ